MKAATAERRKPRTPPGPYFTASMMIPTAVGKIDLGLLARALLAGIRATPVAEGVYHVASAFPTERGPYEVCLDGERATCVCEAAQHNAPCKHVAVARFLAATLEAQS